MMEEKISASRRKSTQEQLRSDHVDLLLRLKSSQNSNKALEAEILELKERLVNAIGFDNPASNYREDWLSASQKSSDLAKELTLTKRNAADDLSRLREQYARASEDYSTTLRRMQQSIKELQDEKRLASEKAEAPQLVLATTMANEEPIAILQSQLHTLQVQLDNLHIEATTLKDHLVTVQNDKVLLQQTVDELNSRYRDQLQTLSVVTLQRDQLTSSLQSASMIHENDLIEIDRLQDENGSLRSELHASRLISDAPPSTAAVTTTIGIQTTAPAEEIHLNIKNASNDSPSVQQIIQQQQHSEEEEMPMGFRFQEYLRLKRENKELKLRLTEKEQSSSYVRNSSVKVRSFLKTSMTLPRLPSQK